VAAIGLALVGQRLGYESLIVVSGSMGDTAPVGSLVVGRPIPVAKVHVGTIILRRVGNQTPVLHRVVERTQSSGTVVVHTKGDANAAPDPFQTTLHGKVITPILVFPRLGYVIAWLRTPLGWSTLILVPLLAAGLSAFRRARHTAPPKHTPEAVRSGNAQQ
jgi:signal peptidase